MEKQICMAHEVVQKTPISSNQYVCVRCGHEGTISDLFGECRCVPHFVFTDSGWMAA